MKKFVFGSCLVFSLFYGDCWGMNNGHNTEDSDSDSSSHSSTSSSLSEEWIASNKELVSKACYEESSFDSLIDEIAKCSDSVPTGNPVIQFPLAILLFLPKMIFERCIPILKWPICAPSPIFRNVGYIYEIPIFADGAMSYK